MTIPRGTIAGTLDPGCTVTRPATALADGQLSCSVPSLTGGQSIVRHVGWVESADEITTDPPTREYSGAYTPGGTAAITDDDELVGTALFSPNVATTTGVTYTGSEPPQTGSPTTFAVLPDQGHAGLVNASLTIALPDNTTLDSIKVEGQTDDYASCQPPSGGSVTCLLPSVRDYLVLDVTVTPTAAAEGSPLTLSASTHGDNAGVVTPGQASSSGNVTP